MCIDKTTASVVAKSVREEFEILESLARSLEYWVSPEDTSPHDTCVDLTAWRLAQVLLGRLESAEFLNAVDHLLGMV